MIKTKSLVIGGSIVIGIAFLMVIYFGLMSLGVVNTKVNTLVIRTNDVSQEYNGETIKGSDFMLLEGKLNESHNIVVEYTGHQVDVGTSLNYANIFILDDNENDVTSQYEIDKQYGTLEILPRKITFISGSLNVEFDGKYFSNKTATIKEGTLLDKHYYRVVESTSVALPGSVDNIFEVRIYDEFDDDVTDKYDIKYQNGKLTIERIKVTFQSLSFTKVYDGKPLDNKIRDAQGNLKEADLMHVDGILIDGHKVKATFTGHNTQVGVADNIYSVIIVDEQGNNVSDYYQINKEYGVLTVLQSIYADDKLPIRPSNSNINVNLLSFETNSINNIYLRDFSFGDFSNNSWNTIDPYQTNDGFNTFTSTALLASIKGRKRSVSINYKRAQIPYLTPNYHLNKFGTNDVHYYGDKTGDTGTFLIEYYDFDFLTYLIKNPSISMSQNTTEEQDRYSQHVRNNYLTVDSEYQSFFKGIGSSNDLNDSMTKPELIIAIKKIIEEIAEYNDQFDTYKVSNDTDILLHFLEDAKEGNSKHFATAATLMFRSYGIPARYVSGIYLNPGAKKGNNNVNEADAHNWVEVYLDGIGWIIVEVTPGFDKTDIVIEAKHELDENGLEKKLIYTGKVYNLQSLDLINIVQGELLEGHRFYYAEFNEQMKDAILYKNVMLENVIIYDEDNNDVTSMYNISSLGQDFTIHKKTIEVKTASGTRQFNNEDFSLDANQIFEVNGIVENEFVDETSVKFPSSRKYYGKTRNEVKFDIRDLNNRSTKHNYIVSIEKLGWIEITPATVTFKAQDASKVYDGTPLVCNEVVLISGDIFGLDFEASTTGSQTNIGKSDNKIDYVKLYDGGIDVSINFNIIEKNGSLRILPPRTLRY